MNIDELRSSYLQFFEQRGHKIVPSSSLIPHGDPTLLLTNAGMVQFKPYFLREVIPDNLRATTCQKCFRTNDIESVGDPNHLTFFEMLGNFSFGDYFKEEAIAWAWEFVTKTLALPKDRLWVTIYQDDDEAFGYWRKLNVASERIVRMGADTNFWGPAGDSGPCGPCSEIHYDFGPQVKCDKPTCTLGCDCGRYSEIWNLVFNQFNQDKDGQRTALAKPGIDTGMGLERTLCVVQGKSTVYETDAFVPMLDKVAELSGRKYGNDPEEDRSMRIVAEHSRGIPFLIGDGVLPSNEGRGYVLRRLLRRATIYGRKIGLDKPFLTQTASLTVKAMGHVYPELREKGEFILQVIDLEEKKFNETLSTGTELVESILVKPETISTKRISGVDAFKLYDTYGFPPELTSEIAQSRGFQLDESGFRAEMDKQRERARSSKRFGLAEKALDLGKVLGRDKSVFVGYDELKSRTTVVAIQVGSELANSIEAGVEATIVLDSTPFYAEMGGQVGDTGVISKEGSVFRVSDAVKVPPDLVGHRGSLVSGRLTVGDSVEAGVDVERRLDIARNHTATHLLQTALRKVLGQHVEQRGSLVAPDRLRFDFSHLLPMTVEQIAETSRMVNEMVRNNLPVYAEEMPYKKALQDGATAIFAEKYGDVVRVMRVGRPPMSVELCGGTHLRATGEIGFFQVVSESSIGASLRRIEAVTGRGAEHWVRDRINEVVLIGQSLEAESGHVLDKAIGVAQEVKELRRRALSLERELSQKSGESLLSQAKVIKGINVLVGKLPPSRIEVLRETSDKLRDQLKSAIIVLGTVSDEQPVFLAVVTPDLVAKGYNAGNIIREVAKVAGGGGGGKPNLAQAGGKDKDKLDQALAVVENLI